jgi:hypothetical protein
VRFEQFSTDSYPVHQRPHAWRDALHLHSLRPEMVPAATPLFGTLTSGRTARGVGLARITSSPQTIQRREVWAAEGNSLTT